jgi:hypothetical protein
VNIGEQWSSGVLEVQLFAWEARAMATALSLNQQIKRIVAFGSSYANVFEPKAKQCATKNKYLKSNHSGY